ncbi:MAG: recombinase RecT [Candidatus Peribacteraceae bacterium]|nr:recombinase RecT [Candidatus Peribacteraceae bacterium]
MSKELSTVTELKKEIGTFIGNKQNLVTLLNTTFKGLTQQSAENAMLEGMIRGFDIKDFLEKNIYAIPFGKGYSLITSIDYARKKGMRSGVVGKSAPEFTQKEDGSVESCTITIKRKVDEYIGEYSATVFFDEYNTNQQQWAKKPRTMICKVAEMHALRMACPEELSQAYAEEEMQKEFSHVVEVVDEEEKQSDIEDAKKKLNACKTLKTLEKHYMAIPRETRNLTEIVDLKNELKDKLK